VRRRGDRVITERGEIVQGRRRLFLVIPYNSTPAFIGPLNGCIYRRGIMLAIVILAIIWAFFLALFEVPARMIGTWFVSKTTPRTGSMGAIQNFLGVILCFAGANLVVMIGAIVVFLGRVGVSSRLDYLYDNDPLGFSFVFAGYHLLVPAFVALLMGYFRARKRVFAATREGARSERLRDLSLNQRTFEEINGLNRRQTFSLFAVGWLVAIPVWTITFFYFREDLSLALTVALACLLAAHIVRMPKLVHRPNVELSFDQSVGALVIGLGGVAVVVFLAFVIVRPPFNDLAAHSPRLYRGAYGTVAISLTLISMLLVLVDYAIVSFFRRFRRRSTQGARGVRD
jgi:hypothetical protein